MRFIRGEIIANWKLFSFSSMYFKFSLRFSPWSIDYLEVYCLGLPGSPVVKILPSSARFVSSIPVWELGSHMLQAVAKKFKKKFFLLISKCLDRLIPTVLSSLLLFLPENIPCMVQFFKNLLRFVLWPRIWSQWMFLGHLRILLLCYCWVGCSLCSN